jgi:hypothetical protein
MTIDEGNKVLWKQAINEKQSLMNNVKKGNKEYQKDYKGMKQIISKENEQFDKEFEQS